MKHSDFSIGLEFYTAAGKWRCTDVGTRTIAAIRIDQVEISNGHTTRILNHDEAMAEGCFNGPPYFVAESSFDEYDIEGCSPEPYEWDR